MYPTRTRRGTAQKQYCDEEAFLVYFIRQDLDYYPEA